MKIQVGDTVMLMVGTTDNPNIKEGEWQVVFEDKLLQHGDEWPFALIELESPATGLLWTNDEGVFEDTTDVLRCRVTQLTRDGKVIYKEGEDGKPLPVDH